MLLLDYPTVVHTSDLRVTPVGEKVSVPCSKPFEWQQKGMLSTYSTIALFPGSLCTKAIARVKA